MKFYIKMTKMVSNAMLLTLYFGFFFVQLTANFDLQNQLSNQHNTDSPQKLSKYIQNGIKSQIVKQAFSSVSSKLNNRLNKRFFPESATVLDNIDFKGQSLTKAQINSPLYVNPFFKGITLDSFSRRGPPVVG
jgi:hypothetical protein